jgi:hypothetical protein
VDVVLIQARLVAIVRELDPALHLVTPHGQVAHRAGSPDARAAARPVRCELS